jgi:hypothetical protein
MEKSYNITDIKFDEEFLIIIIENQTFKLRLTEISDKLANASDLERNDFKISPSGYGIHWRLIDENLSINGLLKH